MILKQYYLGCLAHASYLIADEKSGIAAVVDPQRDIDQYLKDAEQLGLTIRYAILTHFHADFLAGHLEPRNQVGATVAIGARGQAEYSHLGLEDGQSIDLGEVRLEVLATPGHTPEGISLVVYDTASDPSSPHAVLTGDTLFIGDVGRPDLMASVGVTAEELAGMLYDSLHSKLLHLPDHTLIYPAHGAGSLCGRNLSSDTVSTMGEQRRYNYALQDMSKREFIDMVTENQPEAPAYFIFDAMLNRQERPVLESELEKGSNPLKLEDLLRLQNQGAQILDVRDEADSEAAHLLGSLNISLQGAYATWAGTLLDRERPVVIVGEPGQEHEAAVRLGRIGYDLVIGHLEGGMEALTSRPELVESIQRITARALAERLEETSPPLIVDVRTAGEWELEHIEGSLNMPLQHLEQLIDEVPLDREVVVHCGSGYRSAIAASLLQRMGRNQVMDMVGGMGAWEACRLPTVPMAATA